VGNGAVAGAVTIAIAVAVAVVIGFGGGVAIEYVRIGTDVRDAAIVGALWGIAIGGLAFVSAFIVAGAGAAAFAFSGTGTGTAGGSGTGIVAGAVAVAVALAADRGEYDSGVALSPALLLALALSPLSLH
jgi:hypothetical protein